jgi:4-hydroxy-L-threonine phosphate dehydrogenase PdxA
MILNHKVVPNDTRKFVQQCLEEIWKQPDAEKICEVVYTDNPKVDTTAIQSIFLQLYPNHLPVSVLLDIYHGRARVIKEMIKTHPDYRAAKQDLSTIFSLLQKFGHFASPGALSREFDAWCTKYSQVYASSALTFEEQIAFLATNTKQYNYICMFTFIKFRKEKQKATISFNHHLKPLITHNVLHQIELLQQDIESLWNISNFIHLSPRNFFQ